MAVTAPPGGVAAMAPLPKRRYGSQTNGTFAVARRAAQTGAMILLIDNYDSFTFNLVQFLGDLGARCDVRRNDTLDIDQAMAMAPEAIVLSPGPCTPNEAGICLDLIGEASNEIPILGVCLGHQAIGQAFG